MGGGGEALLAKKIGASREQGRLLHLGSEITRDRGLWEINMSIIDAYLCDPVRQVKTPAASEVNGARAAKLAPKEPATVSRERSI